MGDDRRRQLRVVGTLAAIVVALRVGLGASKLAKRGSASISLHHVSRA
jgi:hypothetical protein